MEDPDNYFSPRQLECRIGAKMKISGTVEKVRNHGGLVFIDIKDDDELFQALVIPDNVQAYSMARTISKGYLVEIKGIIKECPGSAQNGKDAQRIEIEVEKMAIISVRSEKENKSKRILDRSKILSGKNKNKIM